MGLLVSPCIAVTAACLRMNYFCMASETIDELEGNSDEADVKE